MEPPIHEAFMQAVRRAHEVLKAAELPRHAFAILPQQDGSYVVRVVVLDWRLNKATYAASREIRPCGEGVLPAIVALRRAAGDAELCFLMRQTGSHGEHSPHLSQWALANPANCDRARVEGAFVESEEFAQTI